MTNRTLKLERQGSAAWLVLDRGERNLLDTELTRALVDELVRLDSDDSVGAVILSGAGTTFSGGADGACIRETGTAQAFADAAVELFARLADLGKPVIAAVTGDALAGGFGLACSADLVITVRAASLGTIETTLGTWPTIAQVPASRRVPPKAALRNVLTGVPFTADEALELGIVDEVLEDAESVLARAAELAELVGRGNRATELGRPLLSDLLIRGSAGYRKDLERGAQAFIELFGG
ncbi:MAG: enoyl-CoA hydratase/isomerase family protein [Leucobacter sp.]|nr:enoyl-CoA hydratase/isomerase family protein [Leucobacter sp.]